MDHDETLAFHHSDRDVARLSVVPPPVGRSQHEALEDQSGVKQVHATLKDDSPSLGLVPLELQL